MMTAKQSQLGAAIQIDQSTRDILAAYERDHRKAWDIAQRNPGTEVTVNGVYAYVPQPTLSEQLFGFKLF